MKDVRAGENQYETINEIMSIQSQNNTETKLIQIHTNTHTNRAGENQYETINEIMSVQSEIVQRQN